MLLRVQISLAKVKALLGQELLIHFLKQKCRIEVVKSWLKVNSFYYSEAICYLTKVDAFKILSQKSIIKVKVFG
jgi:hypothetical protein